MRCSARPAADAGPGLAEGSPGYVSEEESMANGSLLRAACAVIATILAGGWAQANTLYMTGITPTDKGNVGTVVAVDGSSVVTSWTIYGSTLGLGGLLGNESAIAVSSGVTTVGNNLCSGGCAPYPAYAATYTLSGSFTGASNLNVVPQYSPTQEDYLYDGTTDGTHNYAVGLLTGNVYSFDAGWQNASLLFALPGSGWDGITYDPSNNSLWASTLGYGFDASNDNVGDFALNGALLSAFYATTADGINYALAMDPANQTLWFVKGVGGGADQYSRTGTLLGSTSYPGLAGFNVFGAEFAETASGTPEPGTISLLVLGLTALAYHRRSTLRQKD